MKYILLFLDTETTGLNENVSDVIQIAARAEVNAEWAGTINLSCQPFSYDGISQKALEINKMTVDKLRSFNKPEVTFKKLLYALTSIKSRYSDNYKFKVIAHNAEFDRKFLKAWWNKCISSLGTNAPTFESMFTESWFDTVEFAKVLNSNNIIKSKNAKLESLSQYYNLEYTGNGAHDALSDVVMLRDVFYNMYDNYNNAVTPVNYPLFEVYDA